MRKITGVLATGLAAFSLALAPTAYAAADISVGGTCKVSANWTINGSANFDNTYGSPSRGYLDYAVMSSPGGLSATYSTITYYDASGNVVSGATQWHLESSGTTYVYRIDPNLNGIAKVVIDPQTSSASHTYCSGYSSPITLKSKN